MTDHRQTHESLIDAWKHMGPLQRLQAYETLPEWLEELVTEEPAHV